MLSDAAILRGSDYRINEYITIRNPTLNEILDFGEQKYFNMVYTLVSIPSDMKSGLFDAGIDYEALSDFDLFVLLSRSLSQDDTRILFGDGVNLQKMELFHYRDNDQTYLGEYTDFVGMIDKVHGEELAAFTKYYFGDEHCQEAQQVIQSYKDGRITLDVLKMFFNESVLEGSYPLPNTVRIDIVIYTKIVEYLRKVHGLTKKVELAGTPDTKKLLIELDRQDKEMARRKPYESMLEGLVVPLVNCADFKYDYSSVYTLRIFNLLASLKQIQKLKSFNFTMQGVYGGTVDIKKIPKKELTWL